ncbi:MAG: glycosyltransferase [Candidatus Bathyarchaeia archaeon]
MDKCKVSRQTRILFQGIDSLHHYYIVLPRYIQALSQEIYIDIYTQDLLEIPRAFQFSLKRFHDIALNIPLSLLLSQQKRSPPSKVMVQKHTSKYHMAHLNEPFTKDVKVIMASTVQRIPKVLTFHDPKMLYYSKEKIATLESIVYRFDAVTVPSLWMKNIFQEKIGLDPVVIPHCVDFALFNITNKKETARKSLGINAISKVVIWNGRLDPDKDPVTMVNVIKLLAKQDKEVFFILKYRTNYYDPVYTNGVLKEIRRLKGLLGNRLKIFSGGMSLHEMPILYRAADLYFTTSPLESFSLATAEAMACGLPIVAPSSSAIPEVVGDAGVYCNVGDVESFYKNILRILNDDKLSRELSRKSLRRVIRNFNPARIAQLYLDLYKSVLR